MPNASNPYVNICFNPFSTTIRGIDGEELFLISTCYYSKGWYRSGGLADHWETMVFGYRDDDELECYRCDSHQDALEHHLALVKKYSDLLLH